MQRGLFPHIGGGGDLEGGRTPGLLESISRTCLACLSSKTVSTRPYRRVLFALILLCLFVPFLTFRAVPGIGTKVFGTPAAQLQAALPPLLDGGAARPEFYPWETTSYFNPLRTDPKNKTVEQLCESFPSHLLKTIQPVLKLGHGENPDKLGAQLKSSSSCLTNLIIFSDLDEVLHNRTVYDILADLPESYRVDNHDFNHYLFMKELRKNGTLDVDKEATAKINGWILDKYKFLPMVERAWNMNPRRKWYIFYETDTYIVWDNMFRFLENFDPDTPIYMGSPSPGRHDGDTRTWFANGGPGFILSRAAVLRLLKRKVGSDGDFLEPPLSHRWLDLLREECCGDSVLGWALHNVGVDLSGFWPMFNPHPIAGVPFSDLYWCQPVITMHKSAPKDMMDLWKWEHTRRESGRPLLYQDLYEFRHPGQPGTRDDWDNGDWDGFPGPDVASFEECGDACYNHDSCLQWNWHVDSCWFVKCIRHGWAKKPQIEDWRGERNKQGKPWTDEQSRFMSGWVTDKIDKWRSRHKCDVVQWVRPSITRIY